MDNEKKERFRKALTIFVPLGVAITGLVLMLLIERCEKNQRESIENAITVLKRLNNKYQNGYEKKNKGFTFTNTYYSEEDNVLNVASLSYRKKDGTIEIIEKENDVIKSSKLYKVENNEYSVSIDEADPIVIDKETYDAELESNKYGLELYRTCVKEVLKEDIEILKSIKKKDITKQNINQPRNTYYLVMILEGNLYQTNIGMINKFSIVSNDDYLAKRSETIVNENGKEMTTSYSFSFIS